MAEKIKKDLCKVFNSLGLKISIKANLKVENYLDITLDLSTGKYYPYRKPDDKPVYIHTHSNHPPSILKEVPNSIGRRISTLSSDNDVFERSAPLYNAALKSSGYDKEIAYTKPSQATPARRNRKRQIIWFNPPYNKGCATNIGRRFLQLIQKHFEEKSHPLHKIFNRHTLKLSYSCMPNMASIIRSHNKQIAHPRDNNIDPCNCRVKDNCPLSGKCPSSSVIYQAKVTPGQGPPKHYIGLAATSIKVRVSNHLSSLKLESKAYATTLSKYVWDLKAKDQPYDISWSILCQASAYSNTTKRCNLCLAEKLHILKADKPSLLNKRSEILNTCRHSRSFYLSNFGPRSKEWNNPAGNSKIRTKFKKTVMD